MQNRVALNSNAKKETSVLLNRRLVSGLKVIVGTRVYFTSPHESASHLLCIVPSSVMALPIRFISTWIVPFADSRLSNLIVNLRCISPVLVSALLLQVGRLRRAAQNSTLAVLTVVAAKVRALLQLLFGKAHLYRPWPAAPIMRAFCSGVIRASTSSGIGGIPLI